ncbi:MAG: ribosome biogenesis GTPase Der [Spirochaetes bacterium GWB1_36_13]|nr:MAG: ribosome biogenesis GTPase Der [Spirochaetes bacterium GWB1_36_13]
MKNGLPEIAIIGRPNVGKSSVFNALIRKKKSIIDEQAGITRDSIYEKIELSDTDSVYLVDTGGISSREKHLFIEEITENAKQAVQQADLVFFMVEAETITMDDQDLADFLRKTVSDKVILVVNKTDNETKRNSSEAYSLGFDKVVFTSAAHTQGMEELKNTALEFLKDKGILAVKEKAVVSNEETVEEEEPVKLCVVGRPNVGKSSFLNLLADKTRSIVSPIPGTTLDVIEETIVFEDTTIILKDTAGVRRKTKVKEKLEYVSVKRTIQAIEQSDIVLLIVDAETGITDQDKKIAALITERYKGLIIGINKWDLIEKQVDKTEFLDRMRYLLRVASFVPIIEISVSKKYNIERFMKKALSVYRNFNKKVSTPDLVEHLRAQIKEKPLFNKEGNFKIFYAVQTGVKPPSFQIFVNHKELLNDSYMRFLQKSIREKFNFDGIPFKLEAKNRERKEK